MSVAGDNSVDIRREDLSSPAAAALILALNGELAGHYPEAGANHFRLDSEEVRPGRGAFLVAYSGGRAVGCGAVRMLDETSAEIKRMYTAPEVRGSGIAGKLLEALQAEARRLETDRMVLETGMRQPEAISFYLKSGFVRIRPFGEYLDSALSVCMAQCLHFVTPATTLGTRRLILSPLAPDDAEPLYAYRSDPEVRRYQFFEPRSLDDARAFIVAEPAEPPSWHQFGIRLRGSAELAGDIGFRLCPPESRQAEIGVTISPVHQHRGYAAEAVAALAGRLFGDMNVHRVFASVDPRNAASMALFGRLGFRREAHLRESLWFKGEWADDVIFALLDEEWENRQPGATPSGSESCNLK